MLPAKLAFVDIETTGTSVVHDRIIEIAIVRVDNGVVRDFYETLINPQRPISPFISELTSILPHELEHAPDFEKVAQTIYERLEGYVFVAHNVGFDHGFVKNHFEQIGYSFSPKKLCTVRLSRALFPHHPRHNLDSVMMHHNLICENRHRALGDAQVICDFYQKITRETDETELEQVINGLMRQPTLPPHLDAHLLTAVTDTPGVYILYGEGHVPLYVGKSIHVKTRLLSHFSNVHKRSTEMNIARQTIDLEVRPTTGELGALLLEQHLIKTLQPLYNRTLRKSTKLYVAHTRLNSSGYLTVTSDIVTSIGPEDLESIVGIYKSRAQVKTALSQISKEHGLCGILMGLEHGSSCFAYKLGTCRGACIAAEPAVLYNARLMSALAAQSVKRWPYEGAIAILEHDPTDAERADGYVIDKWCFIGKIVYEGQDVTWEYANDYIFDLDVYKILARHIYRGTKSSRIVPVSLQPEWR